MKKYTLELDSVFIEFDSVEEVRRLMTDEEKQQHKGFYGEDWSTTGYINVVSVKSESHVLLNTTEQLTAYQQSTQGSMEYLKKYAGNRDEDVVCFNVAYRIKETGHRIYAQRYGTELKLCCHECAPTLTTTIRGHHLGDLNENEIRALLEDYVVRHIEHYPYDPYPLAFTADSAVPPNLLRSKKSEIGFSEL